MRVIPVIALFLLLACDSKPNLSSCRVIHRPANGCPQGYRQEDKPRFTERDGSKQYACLSDDVTKEMCTDVLKSGESEEFQLQLVPVIPDANPPAPSRDQDKL